MPEAVARALFLYGPFAVLALLVFVMEVKARSQLSDVATSKLVRVSIYVATWLSIFTCCWIAVWVWIRLNVPGREEVIRGRLTGLIDTEEFRSRSKEMFVRRIYDKKNFDFAWRIVSSKKLPPGSIIDLLVDRSTPKSEDVTTYEMPISTDFYETETELLLVYDRESRLLKLRTGNRWIELKRLAVSATLTHQTPSPWPFGFDWLIRPVQAQGPDIPSISRRLESSDAIIRLDARAELAQIGSAAVPFIQEVLVDPDSSYRLRLGVLAALNKMPADIGALSPLAVSAIEKASRDQDPALRGEVLKFLAGPLSATVYVYAPRGAHTVYQLKPSIFVGDLSVARLQAGRFFRCKVAQGHRRFCVQRGLSGPGLGGSSCWSFPIEGGQTYYLRNSVTKGGLGGYKLVLVNESDAREHLKVLKPIDPDLVKEPGLVAVPSVPLTGAGDPRQP